MRTNHSLHSTLTAAALLAAATLTANAQTWQTVGDFQYNPSYYAAGSDIGTDPSGQILYSVGGLALDANDTTRLALVNVSYDQGTSWTPLEQAPDPGWTWGHYRAVASAGNRLFIGGNGNYADGSFGWLIRESVDGGTNWASTDAVADTGCSDIAIHPLTGDVYAGGSGTTLGRVIRKRPAGASQFTTVYSTGPSDIGIVWSIAFHPNGSVIAAGNKVDATTRAASWVVQRSATGDAGTWQIVDTFSTGEWTGYSAGGCLVTTAGTIYVSGSAYNSRKHKGFWVVRTSADGGNTWTLSDNFNLGGSQVQVFEITQDANGNFYVCGQASDNSGVHWIVRKGAWTTTTVKGKTVTSLAWSTSDAYQLAPGKAALPLGITVDASGNVFACGRAQDAAGIEHWIVRRLAP